MSPIRPTLVLALLAGCFGGAKSISLPTAASPVFSITPSPPEMDCGESTYIGSVAVGSGSGSGAGYLVIVPYNATDCDTSSGNGNTGASIYTFDRTGLTIFAGLNGGNGSGDVNGPGFVAQIGNESTPPRVLADGQWVVEAAATGSNVGGSDLAVGTGASPKALGLTIPSITPASVVLDDTTGTLYIAAWPTQNGAFDHDDPSFPGGASAFALAPMASSTGYALVTAPASSAASTAPQSIQFFCESMENCLVGNTDTLFFMAHATAPQIATIGALPKTGSGDIMPIGTIDQSLAAHVGPVGLAADDQHVVWTASIDAHEYPDVGCWVFDYDIAAQTTTQIFSSSKFSCMDAALDSVAGTVYFAIVSLNSDSNEVHGDGIGRVSLMADSPLESIALGMVGDGAGPRRVYLDDDNIFAVDPEVLGRIAKTELDDHHDF